MSSDSLRKTRKILFLDRDDTIIKDFGYLNDPNQVVLLEGLIPALKLFRNSGFEFIVTTNQSGLTRKSVQIENLNLIHEKIQHDLNLHGLRILHFYSAPYLHDHHRRKPNPGLTLNAMVDFKVDIKSSIFAGDKWRDLDVGYKLGGKTLLVNVAKDQMQLFKEFKPDLIIEDWNQFDSDKLNRLENLSKLNFESAKNQSQIKKIKDTKNFKSR